MPKKGKDRRSARDDARDLAGGLGGDEDYDWIKYLGEGRSAGSAASPGSAGSIGSAVTSVAAAPPAARSVTARPPTLPVRPRREPGPERQPDRQAVRPERPADRPERSAVRPERSAPRPDRSAPRPERSAPRSERSAARPDRAGRGEQQERTDRQPRVERSGRPGPSAAPYGTDRDSLPIDDQELRPIPVTRTTPGPAVRLTAGRAVDLVSGQGSDLDFNPAADDYREPLYSEPAYPEPAYPEPAYPEPAYPEPAYPEPAYPEPTSRPRRAARPELDRPELDRPELDRPERDWDEPGWQQRVRPDPRLDTAEYASPLYPLGDTGQFARAGQPRLGGPAALAGPSAPARPSGSAGPGRAGFVDDPLADTDARRRSGPGDRSQTGRPARRGKTGPLPRLDQEAADATGGRLAARAITDGRGRGRGSAEVSFGPVADDDSPEIALLDRQLRYRGSPRKPGKPAKAGRPAGAKASTRKAREAAAPGKSRSGSGRRRSRKVLAIGSVVLVAALAVAGYLVLGPKTAHAISAPATLGNFTRQQADATAEQLRNKIVNAATGDVKNVVAAVYQRKSGSSGNPQIVVFIGGNLAGSASASSLISAYMTRLHGAFTTSAGKLGGQAACAPGSGGGPAECAWADGDTFGVVVSATLSSAALADEMRLMRPQVEHVVK